MVPGVLEEQPGGPCSWSRESEEERARREWRQMFRALWASGRRLTPLYLPHHQKGGDFLSSCPYGASKAVALYEIFIPSGGWPRLWAYWFSPVIPVLFGWAGGPQAPGKGWKVHLSLPSHVFSEICSTHPMSLGAGGAAFPLEISGTLQDQGASEDARVASCHSCWEHGCYIADSGQSGVHLPETRSCV